MYDSKETLVYHEKWIFGIFSARLKSQKQFSHIFYTECFCSAEILELVWNVIKFYSLELLETFSLHAIYQRWNISFECRSLWLSSACHHGSSEICARFYVASSPLAALSRSFFFSAGSIMRLHRKIFHDTKTLLSETFFSISTQPPQTSPSRVDVQKNNLELRVRKTFVQLNRRKINFPSQPFLKRQTSFSANNSLIILFVSWLPIAQQSPRKTAVFAAEQ